MEAQMTREDCKSQVLGRLVRLVGSRDVSVEDVAIDNLLSESYPRANYGKDDYRFGPEDVLEMEREMRRRLRI
jgi:hypothetical protein